MQQEGGGLWVGGIELRMKRRRRTEEEEEEEKDQKEYTFFVSFLLLRADFQ